MLVRLEVNKLLVEQDEKLTEEEVLPVTKEIIYNYDFGDNWIVKITKKSDSEDLQTSGAVSEEEIMEERETVVSKHIPVCIHKDGVFVLDDVDGLGGFSNFLGRIYESEDKEERADHLTWAQSLDWSTRRCRIK